MPTRRPNPELDRRRGTGAPSRAATRGAEGTAAHGSAPLPAGRLDIAALAAAVLGPLALYAATLPRTVVLEDDGLFLMAGFHLGVAHPPGYPIYTLIVHLFTRLPFGDPAVLGHLSSAVLGALACGAMFSSSPRRPSVRTIRPGETRPGTMPERVNFRGFYAATGPLPRSCADNGTR